MKSESEISMHIQVSGFPSSTDIKASACNAGDLGSIPGLGRSPGEEHSSILSWEIPWTAEPSGLACMGLQKSPHNWVNKQQHVVIIIPATTSKFSKTSTAKPDL